jgi:hypothetical protein
MCSELSSRKISTRRNAKTVILKKRLLNLNMSVALKQKQLLLSPPVVLAVEGGWARNATRLTR